MGYIYKITNTVNGKMYIGQTRRTIPIRWHEHIKQSQNKNHEYISILHSAMRKYGVDAFVIEKIESCDNSLLMEREKYWINKLETAKTGYNISLGGQGYSKGYDTEIMAFWEEGYARREIAERVPLHPATISRRLRGMGVSKEEIIKRGSNRGNKKKEKPVYQYDLDGNYIRSFPSLRDAQESIGGRRIKFPPNSKEKQIAGFQWRKTKTDRIDPLRYSTKKRKSNKPPSRETKKIIPKPVVQFAMDGSYIRTFDSINDAACFMQTRIQSIYNICKGYGKSYGGYQWRYLDDAEACEMRLPPHHSPPPKVHVYQYTIEGEYLNEYASFFDAQKQFGMKGTGGIRGACEGRSKQSHGYRWSYEKVDRLPSIN